VAGLLWAAAFEDAAYRSPSAVSLAALYRLTMRAGSTRAAASAAAVHGVIAFMVGAGWLADAASA
jgi:hypothetical protein